MEKYASWFFNKNLTTKRQIIVYSILSILLSPLLILILPVLIFRSFMSDAPKSSVFGMLHKGTLAWAIIYILIATVYGMFTFKEFLYDFAPILFYIYYSVVIILTVVFINDVLMKFKSYARVMTSIKDFFNQLINKI